MGNLKTNPKLLDALSKAARGNLSADQRRKQKLSFIMGMLSDESSITKERIQEELERQHGNAA